MKRLALSAVLALSCTFTQAQTAKPKVRAITAFVRLDSKNYQRQLAEALGVLNRTKTEFKSQGYEVETIRFTTQPLADLTSGMSEDQALVFLGQLDQLAWDQCALPARAIFSTVRIQLSMSRSSGWTMM